MTISSRNNIAMRKDGTTLVLEIETDPSKITTNRSKSGKSLVVATTSGAVPVLDTDLKLNLNLYTPVS